MDYSNPLPPENVNVTRAHPLRELAILATGILFAILVIVSALGLLTEALAPHIPFTMERELAQKFIPASHAENETQVYLQSLANQLMQSMDVPEDMSLSVHYIEDDTENAFATLGGHIFIHKGLLQMLAHENALAMVLAHEIAHVQHRHPVIALGRGLAIGLFLSALAGFSGDRLASAVIGNAAILTSLRFNREQERQADATALAALQEHYGHIGGADDLFKALMRIQAKHDAAKPQFLSTHPVGAERIRNMQDHASEQGWQADGKRNALPEQVQEALLYSDLPENKND